MRGDTTHWRRSRDRWIRLEEWGTISRKVPSSRRIMTAEHRKEESLVEGTALRLAVWTRVRAGGWKRERIKRRFPAWVRCAAPSKGDPNFPRNSLHQLIGQGSKGEGYAGNGPPSLPTKAT